MVNFILTTIKSLIMQGECEIPVRSGLNEEIEHLLLEHPEFGFKNSKDFIRDSIRHHLDDLQNGTYNTQVSV